jgi:hypothetical protein
MTIECGVHNTWPPIPRLHWTTKCTFLRSSSLNIPFIIIHPSSSSPSLLLYQVVLCIPPMYKTYYMSRPARLPWYIVLTLLGEKNGWRNASLCGFFFSFLLLHDSVVSVFSSASCFQPPLLCALPVMKDTKKRHSETSNSGHDADLICL